MTPTEARAIAGTLSFSSKIPGSCYDLPISACRIGQKLMRVKGSTCASCYGGKGQQSWPNALKAQARRLAAIAHPRWTEAMTALLRHLHAEPVIWIDLGLRPGPKLARLGSRYATTPSGWHRWHAVGDLQSLDHLEKIVAVAAATPAIRHWLPTREVGILRAFMGAQGESRLPANLTLRLSASMIDRGPPAGWLQTSTVHTAAPPVGHLCPAPTQDHKCGACRACWNRDVPNVSYRKH